MTDRCIYCNQLRPHHAPDCQALWPGRSAAPIPSNVVSLKGDPIPAGQPVADVVKAAEWLLNAATAGEITGVAFTAHYRDGASEARMQGMLNYSNVGRLFSLANSLDDQLSKS